MKKLVGLLLTFAFILGAIPFTAFASVDVSVNPATAENSLTALTTGGNTGFSANNVEKVTVETDTADADNKIFKITGDGTSQSGSYALVNRLTSGANAFYSSEVNRFSAKIKLSDVTDIDAATEVFVPSRGWGTAASSYTFGVKLKTGGAYYWDEENSIYEAFVASGTMSADKWYRIEAVMDNRETALDGNKTYMNAFIYDVEDNNKLIGTSGWQYVSNDAPYSGNCSFLSVQIQSYLYSPDYPIYVDEFNVFKVTELPTYSVGIGEAETNKYITTPSGWLTSTGSTSTFRSVGEWFTTATTAANALISAESANKAVRVEMSVRFPELPTSAYDTYNLLKFYNQIIYKANNTEVFDGTVHITKDGLEVLSYTGETGKYDTAVTLSDSSTAYAISANQWYTLVWDVDFTVYDAPTAKLTVKDADGKVLVTTPTAYAASPLVTNNYNQSMILYAGVTNKDKVVHIDNTKVYGAATLENLDAAESRTVAIDEDFEVYDNALYADGSAFNALVAADSNSHLAKSVTSLQDGIVIAQESLPVATFVEGTEFDSIDPITFTFTYDNPVPVDNITEDSIKLLAGNTDIEMTYGEHYGITYDDSDGDGKVTAFTVSILQPDYSTSYKLRLMAELADYNEALSGGVPADSGLYKDITFSVGEYVPGLTFTGTLVDENGAAIDTSATLSANQKIKGKVALTNIIDDPAYCYVILALYDGNQLADLVMTDKITVAPGSAAEEHFTGELTTSKDGLTAKLFVWNSLEFMNPFGAPVTVPAAS